MEAVGAGMAKRWEACMLALVLVLSSSSLELGASGSTERTDASAFESRRPSLTIYTPHEQDPMEVAVKEFQETTGILVDIVQGGTGELLARIRSEANQGQVSCDVFWGGGAESIAANADLFEPCIAIQDAKLPLAYQGKENLWVGESPAPVVLVYNSILVEPGKVPHGWADLADPVWRGKIAFANPAKSGSAYTLLCTMITAMGGPDEGGWEFIETFVENLDGRMLENSSDAYALVAKGEFYIGLTQEKSASTAKRSGASIEISYPGEGTSAVPDAIAIVKGCENTDLAMRFIDFILGYENQHIMAALFNRRPVRSDVPPPDGLPPMEAIALVEYDLEWAAGRKDSILARWSEAASTRR